MAFDRGEDFDSRMDPIVRVQARNLRVRLGQHYAGAGANDPIVIELPKWTYVPVFRAPEENPEPAAANTGKNAAQRFLGLRPAVTSSAAGAASATGSSAHPLPDVFEELIALSRNFPASCWFFVRARTLPRGFLRGIKGGAN
jgi:hypothetical protein